MPAQEERQKEEGHDDQRNGRQPLVAGRGQPLVISCLAGHAHKLLGGNIGRDQRHTDQPPLETAARQEVGLAVALVATLPNANPHHDNDEGNEDCDVQGC